MARWQGRSLRKPSGGRIWARRKKRRRELGSEFLGPTLGPRRRVKRRIRGGGERFRYSGVEVANVANPESGRAELTKIIRVFENPADPHFVRGNVLTRGAMIETELGKARVTSRPGREGIVNAVLIGARKPIGAEKSAEPSAETP